MSRDELDGIDREALIERVLDAHREREQLQGRLEQAEQQLRWFKRQLFGTKSERRLVDEDGSQLCLGESIAPKAETPAETTVRSHVRRSRLTRELADESGLRFDESVPRERIEIPNSELDGLADDACTEIQEKKTYRIAQRPGSYVVLEIVRKVVKRADTGELSCPPAPPAVLEKSYADVSLLAGLLVDKFRYHLPLYRQHQRMAACGITVSRVSLTNWVHRTIELLEPIYAAQLESILESAVLAMDEAPIRAGRKSKGKMRTAFFWPLYGDRDEVAFPYASSRARAHVPEILGDFSGTLLTDGYEAYAHYTKAEAERVHALCWVHARRGFVKAQDVEPQRSQAVLDAIGTLYELEAEFVKAKLEGSAKLQARAEQSKPVVDALFAELERERRESALLPSNPFTKALSYVLERREGLQIFLSDPDVPLDTNHLERALRPIPMGRKNWLFCWTEIGAERVGQIQSLISTCVLHGVDPYTYLVDVLQRIDHHPQADVQLLTPRCWKHHFADNPLRSMIDDHGRLHCDASG